MLYPPRGIHSDNRAAPMAGRPRLWMTGLAVHPVPWLAGDSPAAGRLGPGSHWLSRTSSLPRTQVRSC
jgi:hypothetical protein